MGTDAAPTQGDPVRAIVVSGRQEAAGFVSVPWVRQQLRELLGHDPYPGTLNVRVDDPASQASWRRRASTGDGGVTMPAGEAGFCDSTYFPVLLNADTQCAVVLPHVPDYPTDVVEMVAPENLRDQLGLRDGDEVSIQWQAAEP